MKLEEKIINYRREFHTYPELGWREIRTSARIAEILDQMGCEKIYVGKEAINPDSILSLVRMTEEEKTQQMQQAIAEGASEKWVAKAEGYPGVVAEFDSGKAGKVIAFRFDIDALPDTEEAIAGRKSYDEGYISKHEGIIHSCGHDGHTAIGLGLAELLAQKKDSFTGKIRLLFQPAEETYSGAESIRDQGWLDDVDNFVALHLILSHEGNPMESGSLSGGSNDFLSDTQLDVDFIGKAAHPAGASQEGKNAILAAATAILNLHAIAKHEEGLSVVNVGIVKGGAAANVIAPNASITVEYRGESKSITAYLKDRVHIVIQAAADMYGCDLNILDYGEIPTAKSDEELIDQIIAVGAEIPFFKKIHRYSNVGGTDDATVMMNHVQKRGGKASYFSIGADAPAALHNSGFDFDEAVLEPAAQLLYKLCLKLNQ